ncbi:MAG: hypothetical protein HQL87_10805 [Magnetococcales bacterium]|nr:hypothetical protein [Magnetococcales bacterium]
MRVTDNMMLSASLSAMQAQQQALMLAQSQSSSGQRIQKPSDDAAGSYRNLLFGSDLTSVQSLQNTTNLASQRLTQGGTAVGVVQNSMEQAYELAMQFSQGTAASNAPETLKSSASSAMALYQDIVSAANTEMNGVPLFGGGRTSAPFDATQNPPGTSLCTTAVQVQSSGATALTPAPSGFAASVADSFQAPGVGPSTAYQIAPSTTVVGGYDVTVNGVAQTPPVMPTQQAGSSSSLDLGNGITFNLGGQLSAGDSVSFNVVPNGAHFQATPAQLSVPVDGVATPSTVDASTAFSAQVAPDATLTGIPLSVQVTYQASNGTYDVDVNGVPQIGLQPQDTDPPSLNLGNGLTFNLVGQPQSGDVYYFEVVPSYQGGSADCPIHVGPGQTLPGNVTGAELVNGSGTLSNNVNLLGAVTALRGALLRGDANEVTLQLNRLTAGQTQASNLQATTGVRATQVTAAASTLSTDQLNLQTLKTNNSEADMFDVVSRLTQATNSLQMLTSVERTVSSVSLLNFLQ